MIPCPVVVVALYRTKHHLHIEFIMIYRKYIYAFISVYLFSIFHVVSADEGCDKSKCKGPLKYYEEIQCTPIYGSDDTCCPVKYNCDHLKERSRNKCYYKGHAYEIKETLRAEDAGPCDSGCFCRQGFNGAAGFTCAIVDCFWRAKPGCYLKKSHTGCCGGPEVCPKDEPEIARCEVDGQTYFDGQRFTPSSDPTQSCICAEGYTGENVPPFCKRVTPHTCGTELRHASDIYYNCTPVFYSSQNPATDCHLSSRCQNKDDRVLKSEDTTGTGVITASDPGATCIFGQLTMKMGDQLNQATHYSSVCVKCVCEVPPLPTCQRLPDNECDVTVHPQFDYYSV